jgi:hypothetical protein
MKYRFSNKFLKQKRTSAIRSAMIFVAWLLGLGGWMLSGGDVGVEVIGLSVFIAAVAVVFAYQRYQEWKFWTRYGSEFELEVTGEKIIQRSPSGETSFLKDGIKNVDLQISGGLVKSIIVAEKMGGGVRFEGLNDMENLRTELEEMVGVEKIRERRWMLR